MANSVWVPNVDATMTGNAWRFEGVLDVDYQLCPIHKSRVYGKESARKLSYIELMEALRPLALEPVDPDFHKKVQRGDFLIGGDCTGYGHDHEQGCIALRAAGIAAVLCEGTNVNFHRNSINNGLPVVVVKGIMDAVKTGDKLELNLLEGWVKNVTTSKTFNFKPWPDFIVDIIRDGGLYPFLRETTSAV